jgi:hypothetical protein
LSLKAKFKNKWHKKLAILNLKTRLLLSFQILFKH